MATRRELLIKGCNSLLKGRIPDTSMRVCWNLQEKAKTMSGQWQDAYQLVAYFSEGFKEQKGSAAYPLRNFEDYSLGYWVGANRKLRFALLRHIRAKLLAGESCENVWLDEEYPHA